MGKTRKQKWLALTTASAMGMGVAVVAATPALADAESSLIAAYDFTQAPSDNVNVPNDADSAFGAAQVHNPSADLWSGTGLSLTGGSKNSSGSWVELPEDLLDGAESATIQLEVKPDASMLNEYHFLFNIGNDSNDEYLFAALACKEGRTPLVGLKDSGSERLIGASSCVAEPDRFQSVTAVVDGDESIAELYIDGERVARGSVAGGPNLIEDQSLNTIGRSPWPDVLFKGEIATFRVFDEALSAEEISQIAQDDAQLVEDDLRSFAQSVLDDANLSDLEVSDAYVTLPSAQGRITWQSSNTNIITDEGQVNRPSAGADPVEVDLTATVSVRGVNATQTITATVVPDERSDDERLAQIATGFVVPPVLQDGDELAPAPMGVEVEYSADGEVEIIDGAIKSQTEGTTSVIVTATLTLGGTDAAVTKEFEVQVLPESDSQKVLVYHRQATDHETANNGDVAYSMHLALEEDDAWLPLNGNYGIFFARTTESPENAVDVKLGTHRSLRSPSLFYLENGDYGIVAVRTKQGSDQADETGATSILFATSKDLLAYDEQPDSMSIIDVGETNGVNDPYAVFDSATGKYVVGWTNDSGIPKFTTFDELQDSDSQHGEVVIGEFSQYGNIAQAQGVDNYVPGREIVVTSQQATALEGRFGRIVNTGIENLGEITVEAGADVDEIDLPSDVELTYSDGSTNTLPIEEWDITNADLANPGTVIAQPKIKQTEYPTPFAEERADPVVEKWEWEREDGTHTKYLMIATNDIHGDNVWQNGNPKMPVRMADSIMELADTPGDSSGLIDGGGHNPKESILLRAGDKNSDGQTITGSLWAPEFHEIDGRLSILFMPSYNNNWADGAAAIMQLKQDDNGYDLDPTKPESWTVPKTVTRADGSPLSLRTDGTRGMSLDMTYFQDEKGQSYYAWQQLGAVYLATMDPADPARVTSDPVLVVSPEYAWDNAIAEGPNVVNRDGTLFMIYSGSGVGPTYTTGLAMADASGDTDLTDPTSWSKLNYPIQKSSLFNDDWQLGTGHGMWSEDEDGQMIYVFHAYANQTDGYSNFGGRDMFIRRVHWAADGMPVFDMGLAEEVSEYLDVAVTINVVESDVQPEPDPDPEQPGDGEDADGSGEGSNGDATPGDGSGSGDGTGDNSEVDGEGAGTGAGELPRTGAEIATVTILALLLLIGGGVLVTMRRKAVQ